MTFKFKKASYHDQNKKLVVNKIIIYTAICDILTKVRTLYHLDSEKK